MAFQFTHAGQFLIGKDKTTEDNLMEVALEAGAEDPVDKKVRSPELGLLPFPFFQVQDFPDGGAHLFKDAQVGAGVAAGFFLGGILVARILYGGERK